MNKQMIKYHKSITQELENSKDRVRALLHPAIHWGNDGRYKEEVLKEVLARHLPRTFGISSGFVKIRTQCTSEIDIILTDKSKGTLFQSKDICITTPSNVEAIVEVKTSQKPNELAKTLKKHGDNAAKIRSVRNEDSIGGFSQTDPWASLFVYNKCRSTPDKILKMFDDAAGGDFKKVIQCACFGPDIFVRYWDNSATRGYTNTPQFNGWEFYELKGLAYSYFISNIIWQDKPSSVDSEPWFALPEGKNPYKKASLQFTFRR